MFKELTKLNQLVKDLENACNSDRVLNPAGETWQDRAYYKAREAREISEQILGEAMDRILKDSK